MQKIRASVESTLEAMAMLSRFSDTTKHSNQLQRSFILRPLQDGLEIESTDGFTVASTTAVAILPIGFEPGEAIAVHSAKFQELLLNMSSAMMDLEIVDHADHRGHDKDVDIRIDAALKVIGGRNKFDLYGLRVSGSLLPERDKESNKARFTMAGQDFADLLRLGLSCAATSRSAALDLGSVHFEFAEADRFRWLKVSGTDGYRGAVGERAIKHVHFGGCDFSLAYRDAKRLAMLLNENEFADQIEIVLWGRNARAERLILSFDGCKIDMPTMNTTAPAVAELIDQHEPGREIVVNGADLKQALDTTKIFAEARRVRINSNPRGHYFSSESLIGDVACMIDVHLPEEDETAEPVEIMLDIRFINDFIAATRAVQYSLWFAGQYKPMLMHPHGDPRDRTLLMPMIFATDVVEDDEAEPGEDHDPYEYYEDPDQDNAPDPAMPEEYYDE